ncbi:hypothetical protein CEXT_502221 [Caerostris extrusa]|uniref:Uncharacterized protein n=1 Tax=Caerostris extrusa TaxID=172846 RepID=A0AAV4U8W2_CAEEX|nr:hypothetical protein CEXT_502221 [Caerostris extrusa]
MVLLIAYKRYSIELIRNNFHSSRSAVPGVNNWGWRPQTGMFWRDNIEGIVTSASCVSVFAANDQGLFYFFLLSTGDIISPRSVFAFGIVELEESGGVFPRALCLPLG